MEVLSALGLLKERGVELALALAGPVKDGYLASLTDHARRLGLENSVRYFGRLSSVETIRFQNQASIGLVCYLPTSNSIAGLPNKLLECMGVGLPVVFSHFPNYHQVAGETGAGIAVDPTRPAEIAGAVERLVRNPAMAAEMGLAGKRAVCRRFNWEVERSKLIAMYHEVLGLEKTEREEQQLLAAGSRGEVEGR
jgi:glycosyltransferase involved in cell wall biosynthesis